MEGELILVVDDNATNRKVTTLTLAAAGYDVQAADDAEAALELLATLRPSLILMDLQLPGMDGLTLTRQLKAAPATRDITIVAVTASAMKGDEERALAAGCDGYIGKPIDTRTLGDLVAGYLASRRAP